MYSLYLVFFKDTATTEIYTLSLHDALPIWAKAPAATASSGDIKRVPTGSLARIWAFTSASIAATSSGVSALGCEKSKDRKSTRLNSSHSQISYAVFCLKKKKKKETRSLKI